MEYILASTPRTISNILDSWHATDQLTPTVFSVSLIPSRITKPVSQRSEEEKPASKETQERQQHQDGNHD